MSDRVDEVLSALLDDEANELEVQRLIKKSEESSFEKMSRYSAVSALLGKQKSPIVDIREQISQRLMQEDTIQGDGHAAPVSLATVSDVSVATIPKSEEQGNPKGLLWAGFAAAASVMLAVLIVFWGGETNSGFNNLVAGNEGGAKTILNEKAEARLQVILDQQLFVDQTGKSAQLASQTVSDFDNNGWVGSGELSETQRLQLSEYMLRHAENGVSRLTGAAVPYARLASFSSGVADETGKQER